MATQKLDMKSAREVTPMVNFAHAHGYKRAEIVVKKTSTGKEVKRLRFDGADEYKISPKALALCADGEYSIKDLQYAEYLVEGGDKNNESDWVKLFVPAGSKIVSEDVLVTDTF